MALAAVFLFIAIGYGLRFFVKVKPVAFEFLTARQEAARVSQIIVNLTKETASIIEAVNLFDLGRNIDRSVDLIREARSYNGQAYERAFDLARKLQSLTVSLEEVPSESQRPAYEAVAIELSLVSEFIVYTQNLNRFLESLAGAIATDSFADRLTVQNTLLEVNKSATKINELNKQFLIKITEFDRSL